MLKAKAAEFTLFGADATRDGIVELIRVRSLDGAPAVLQRSWLARDLFGAAAMDDLQDALEVCRQRPRLAVACRGLGDGALST